MNWRRLLNAACAGAILTTLAHLGHGALTWPFWLIFVLTMVISINSERAGEKSLEDALERLSEHDAEP